jgi:hypothetical protein
VNHSFPRRCAALVAGPGAAVLLVCGGCVPATSANGAAGTTDLFATLATFVGDFFRQILAAFLF